MAVWRPHNPLVDPAPPMAVPAGGGRRPGRGAFAAGLALLRLWHERARQRRALARLDDRLLRDIGITRAEANREINKPFWR